MAKISKHGYALTESPRHFTVVAAPPYFAQSMAISCNMPYFEYIVSYCSSNSNRNKSGSTRG